MLLDKIIKIVLSYELSFVSLPFDLHLALQLLLFKWSRITVMAVLCLRFNLGCSRILYSSYDISSNGCLGSCGPINKMSLIKSISRMHPPQRNLSNNLWSFFKCLKNRYKLVRYRIILSLIHCHVIDLSIRDPQLLIKLSEIPFLLAHRAFDWEFCTQILNLDIPNFFCQFIQHSNLLYKIFAFQNTSAYLQLGLYE